MSELMLIVGGGLAAAKAAETLREQGFDGPVTVVAAEPVRPYERPPLSKGRLAGTEEPDGIFVHDPQWYPDHDVTLLLGNPATAVDAAGRTVTLADGSSIEYGKLLLATGSRARALPLPGFDAANVLTLRTVADADRLGAELTGGGKHLVVVGAGWIGLEVAATARGLGNEVTVLEPEPVPLRRALGDRLGAVFADLHRSNGVDLRLSTSVTGAEVDNGVATAVLTESGDRIPADLILVGVGAAAELALAESAGLDIDGGVLVDAALRTSDRHIWAAGDIAAVDHPLLGRTRVEHWGNALAQGPVAARSMLGQQVEYDTLPYFFTDQYDLGMEYTGLPAADDQVVIRGDLDAREFIAFWTRDGRVTAGMNVNIWDVTDDIGALIRSGAVIDRARLADPAVPLGELAGG